MFPIAVPPLADLEPALQAALLAIVDTAQAQDSPFLLHTLGVPGAGKSTLVAALSETLKSRKPVVVAFDRLMDLLPGYKALSARDPMAAFATYEAPACQAGYRLLQMLLEARANIIFDHSGANARHVDLLLYAASIGYKVSLVPVTTRPDLALQRIAARQSSEGRYTPPSLVAERQVLIQQLLPSYKALGVTLHEIDNDGDYANSLVRFQAFGQQIAKVI